MLLAALLLALAVAGCKPRPAFDDLPQRGTALPPPGLERR
jgi:hypothetical protein